jgi:hypothetical protein
MCGQDARGFRFLSASRDDNIRERASNVQRELRGLCIEAAKSARKSQMPASNKARLFNSEVSVCDNRDNL